MRIKIGSLSDFYDFSIEQSALAQDAQYEVREEIQRVTDKRVVPQYEGIRGTGVWFEVDAPMTTALFSAVVSMKCVKEASYTNYLEVTLNLQEHDNGTNSL